MQVAGCRLEEALEPDQNQIVDDLIVIFSIFGDGSLRD